MADHSRKEAKSSTPISGNSWTDNYLEDFHVQDNALAKQFYLLPVQDRNEINEEIHGVRSMEREETHELVQDSLEKLSIALHNLPPQYKYIYQRACSTRYRNPEGMNAIKTESLERLVENMEVKSNGEISSQRQNPSEDSNEPPCYVKSQNFQLAFLRSEFFDAKKAALRMAKYLELVCDLCGEDALRRPLRVDDFKSKEEVEILGAGFQQLLPFRDRCGRRVLFVHGDMNLPSSSLMDRSVLNKGPAMKVLLYLWSVLLEDIEAQRRGVVIIFWPRYVDHSVQDSSQRTEPQSRRKKGNRKARPRKFSHGNDGDTKRLSNQVPDANSRSVGIKFFEAVPVRACAFHICLPDIPFLRMIRNVLLFILGENFRARVKSHDGIGIEVVYSLMGYGIPVDILPFDEVTQTLKTKNSASFMRVRRKIEAEQSEMYSTHTTSSGATSDSNSSNGSIASESMIECPSLNDVIFRSGKSYMSHPGNMMFRELIEQHINEHNVATQDRKKNLTWQVIEEVEMKGGRFLEYNRGLGTWTELTDRNAVRHKIATYFKEFRRKLKAQQQVQIHQSSTHEFELQDGRSRKKQKRPSDYVSDTCFSYLG